MVLDLIRTTRRTLLLRLAASAAGAAAVATGVAASEPTAEEENPDIVRLGDMLPGVIAEYDVAVTAYWNAYHRAMKLWPVAPDSIVSSGSESREIERDIRGFGMLPDKSIPTGNQFARTLIDRKRIEWVLDDIERQLRRKRVKRPMAPDVRAEGEAYAATLRARLADLDAYEAGKDRAREAVNWAGVHARKEAAQDALCALTRDILAAECTTMAGVVIKAQALDAWHREPIAVMLDTIDKRNLAAELAGSILAIAGQGDK